MNSELKHTPAYNYHDKQNTASLSVPTTPKIVAAHPKQAEEVPTIPIDSMELVASLRPGIRIQPATIHSLSTPLVAQSPEHQRSLNEWLQIWWEGIRPAYLSLSLLPILLGTTLAWTHTVNTKTPLGRLDLDLLIGGIVIILLIQIGGHLLNDYYDYVCGIDSGNIFGSGGLIQQRYLEPILVLKTGLILLGIGTLFGIILSIGKGNLLYIFGLLIVLGTYFYSAPPRPLSSVALGEITGFLLFGPFLTLSAYMAQTGGRLESSALIYSIPPGLLALAVIHANNLRDRETDANALKMTLANIVSIKASRIFYVTLLAVAYGVVGLVGVRHNGPHLILITFWTLPLLVIAINGILQTEVSASFHRVMHETIRIEVYFVVLLIIGLVIATLVPMLPQVPTF